MSRAKSRTPDVLRSSIPASSAHAISWCLLCILTALAPVLRAQPIRAIRPIGPVPDQDLTGPANLPKILPGAPRLAATVSILQLGDRLEMFDSTYYTYAAAGARAFRESMNTYRWLRTSGRIQTINSFDPATGAVVGAVLQRRDSVSGAFLPSATIAYINDAQGRTRIATYQSRDTLTGKYSNTRQTIDILNPEGYLMDRLVKAWDIMEQRWNHERHTVYTRNRQGAITSEAGRSWAKGNGQAYEELRTEYDYDHSGLVLTGYRGFTWDPQKPGWTLRTRTSLKLNNAGRPVTAITERFSREEQKWDSIMRYTYEYDPAGNLTLEVSEHYSDIRKKFTNSDKRRYSYNRYNQLLSSESGYVETDGQSQPAWIRRNYYEE